MKPPQTVSEMYPDPWLKAEDLNGRSCVVTIQRVTIEEFPENPNNRQSKKIYKAVLDFGRQKRLICNKTQAESVAAIAKTEEFARWNGARLTLAPGTAHNGKPTIVITQAPAPAAAPAPAPTVTPAPKPAPAQLQPNGTAMIPNPMRQTTPTPLPPDSPFFD